MKKTNLLSLFGVMSALLVSSAFAGFCGGSCGRRGFAPRKAAPGGRSRCQQPRGCAPAARCAGHASKPAIPVAPKVAAPVPFAYMDPVKPVETVKREVVEIQARFKVLDNLIKKMEAATDKTRITTAERNVVRQAIHDLRALIQKLDTVEYNKQRIVFNELRQRFENNKGKHESDAQETDEDVVSIASNSSNDEGTKNANSEDLSQSPRLSTASQTIPVVLQNIPANQEIPVTPTSLQSSVGSLQSQDNDEPIDPKNQVKKGLNAASRQDEIPQAQSLQVKPMGPPVKPKVNTVKASPRTEQRIAAHNKSAAKPAVQPQVQKPAPMKPTVVKKDPAEETSWGQWVSNIASKIPGVNRYIGDPTKPNNI